MMSLKLWGRSFIPVGGGMFSFSAAFFCNLGQLIGPMLMLDPNGISDLAVRNKVLGQAGGGLQAFIEIEENKIYLPRSCHVAKSLLEEFDKHFNGESMLFLQQHAIHFFHVVLEELNRTPIYVLGSKGNLSIDALINGASKGYPADVLPLLDSWMIGEIDSAGKCLACTQYTACGFHILRSVEIALKALVHHFDGSLVAISERSWGAYTARLKAEVSGDLIDLIHILKRKRNPIMHPTETLDMDDAIELMCVSQSILVSLLREVKSRNWSPGFTTALVVVSQAG